MIKKIIKEESGFSMTELMVALVIIGVLVLLALPKFMPVVNKAKATEAKLGLKQVYMLQKAYKLEYDKYAGELGQIGFEQEKLITDGGNARYDIKIISSDIKEFTATATAVVDFDDDGTFNVWEVTQDGNIKEIKPD